MVGIDYDTTLIDVCGDNMMSLKIPSSTYRLVCDFASSSLRYLDDPPFVSTSAVPFMDTLCS